MPRTFFVLLVVAILHSTDLWAQQGIPTYQLTHQRGVRVNFVVNQPPPVVVPPSMGVSCFGGGHRTVQYHLFPPVYVGTFMPQPMQMNPFPAPMSWGPVSVPFIPVPIVMAPPKSISQPSSLASKQKSQELQAKGDLKMRDQKWADARTAYSAAISAAPERAEPHLRLAYCNTATMRFDAAVEQLKLALTIDPELPRKGATLETVFGPGSPILRSSIINKLEIWAAENQLNADRRFLLGVMLHFNGDKRAEEVLEAAVRLSASSNTEHIYAFLNQPPESITIKPPVEVDEIPLLKDKPAPLVPAPSGFDQRFPKQPAA